MAIVFSIIVDISLVLCYNMLVKFHPIAYCMYFGYMLFLFICITFSYKKQVLVKEPVFY